MDSPQTPEIATAERLEKRERNFPLKILHWIACIIIRDAGFRQVHHIQTALIQKQQEHAPEHLGMRRVGYEHAKSLILIFKKIRKRISRFALFTTNSNIPLIYLLFRVLFLSVQSVF